MKLLFAACLLLSVNISLVLSTTRTEYEVNNGELATNTKLAS